MECGNLGHLETLSEIYETESWGPVSQGAFLNQVLVYHTNHDPFYWLEQCQTIEIILGREKVTPWGPRIIDIDILIFGQRVIDEPNLQIPHPRILERRFVLIPLTEISPDIKIPNSGQTALQALENCRDFSSVQLYSKRTD